MVADTLTNPTAARSVEAAVQIGLLRQMGQMLRALRESPVAKVLLLLAAAIVAVVAATAYGQIRLNAWNKDFYDALSRRDFRGFLYYLGVFFVIAGVLLVLNVAQRWLVETLKLRLREGLVKDMVGHWMLPRRAFWLAHAGQMGVNPDQRMHEDARNFCDLSADLSVGLLQASILFFSFAGILWTFSDGFSFRIGEADYVFPGFMLWAAVIYAAAGSLLSYWVGRSLIDRNAERYAREADLRFSLIRINEHLDGISLAAGEADERRRAEQSLERLLAAGARVVRGVTQLTWVTSGFGWITLVAPILVAAPLYFSGKISFGGLMMAAAAFSQAQSSLRWFVDNFSVIADWRAALLRVASFRQALTATDLAPDFQNRIDYIESAPGTLTLEDVVVESPTGRDCLDEPAPVVRSGERVLIVATPGTGKTLLFRALAGLWPWGRGRIGRPARESIAYMPAGTPYLPSGTLREILAYPEAVDRFDEPAFAHALVRSGLTRLVPMLDLSTRWDRELSQDEQLALAFARLVLQRPDWVIIDDAFAALDDEALERVIDVFATDLRHTAVIHIGRPLKGREPVFSRVLHLVKAPANAPVMAAPAP